MTQQHPISPPPDLVRKWATWRNAVDEESFWRRIATEAAQWGADQELEACCEWVSGYCPTWPDGTKPEAELRAARRPLPPTLAEQATAELDDAVMRGDCVTTTDAMPLLRAALNRLVELEAQQ
jgi:hypothetical protein